MKKDNNYEVLVSAIIFTAFVLFLMYHGKAEASQQVCTQFNNSIVCQNYNDKQQYTGNSQYNRQGNSNQWMGTSDQLGGNNK